MRAFLFCLILCAAGAASADTLAEANKLLEAKSYPQAVQMLSKLADGGNADAQLRLGELYWYGEGVALDRAKGDALFARAAASGSKAALEAVELSSKRGQRSKDIAYWTSSYDGADLRSGTYLCEAPVFPAVSTNKDEIQTTAAKADAWVQCYKGFVDNMASAMPPGKRIPEDVLTLMSDQEVEQAKTHLDKVYAGMLATAKAEATSTLAQRDAWIKATNTYVAETNKANEARTKEAQRQLETAARNFRSHPELLRPTAPTTTK